MRNALFILVDVLPVEEIPLAVAIPSSAQETSVDEEGPRCFRDTRKESREVAQYSLIVGIAMDLPYSINLAAAVGAMAGVYIDCHIKKARNNNRTE